MDIISSEIKIEFKTVAIIGYIYSFLIAFFFLNYYRNRKYMNCFIFLLNVLHLSLIFFFPLIAYITLTREKSLEPVKDDNKCFLTIKIINIANHVLNKLIYPLIVIYCKSGYITFLNKFTHVTFSDVFYELYAYPFIIIILIIYFPLKDQLLEIYNDDDLLYFLNYLNILDLLMTYFEIGFSCGSLLRYFFAVFTRREEYKLFILGKLSLYQQEIKKEFTRRFTKFMILSSMYSADIYKYKFDCINKFIADVNTQQYYKRELYPREFEKVVNINKSDLERVLAKPFGLSKDLFRRIKRIENLRKHQINSVKRIRKKRCCGCIYNCCIASICKRIKCIIFAVVCIAILVSEGFYFSKNEDVLEIYKQKDENKSLYEYDPIRLLENTVNNSTNNGTDTDIAMQLGYLLLLYPFYLLTIFVTCGLYIIPIFYSITQRTFITGDFMYDRSSSDTLEMVISVRKLTSKIFSAIYLSCLFYITFILNETFPTDSNGEYNEFLKFFYVPHSPFILAFRYVYIVCVMILTRIVEKINCGCCEFAICDECCFEPHPLDPCISCFTKEKRETYIEEGRRETEKILGSQNPKEIHLLS